MKNHFFYGVILCLMSGIFTEISAQKSIGIPPFSTSEEFKEVQTQPPLLELAPPDMQAVLEEDLHFNWGRNGVPIRVNIDIHSAGNWTELQSGAKLWQLKIKVKNAKGLMLDYSAFQLPKEATLHLYNADKSQILGAYSSINNANGGAFATDMVIGDELIMEYFQPADCQGIPKLTVSDVNYIYQKESNLRDVCEIGINCPEGDDWQVEKKGVVRIRMKFNNGQLTATGVIVNNTSEDGLPYVLTSFHRLLRPQVLQNSTPQFENFIFYFNDEIEECGDGGLANNYSTMTGCIHIASHTDSDLLLLRIDGEIPDAPHDARYLGWNRTPTPPGNATSIYQSVFGFKEIAVENNSLEIHPDVLSTDIHDYPTGHFFNIDWDNGHTEDGGQGAPVLDNSGNVRGWMTFPEECGADESFAARLYNAWEPANASIDEQLKPWLDPDNKGNTQQNGLHVTSPGGGGGCCSSGNVVSQANVAVLGAVSQFISEEMRGNYKLLEEAYIDNMAEINEALSSDHPKYQPAQAALNEWIKETRRNFFRAFIFEMDNKVSEKGIKSAQKVLEEFAKIIPGASFQEMTNKVSRLMQAAVGKDLKSGLIAFDRANLEDFPAEILTTSGEQSLVGFTVLGNPGAEPIIGFSIPETGRVNIEVFDLKGQLLATPLNAVRDAGKYYLPIEAVNAQSGLLMVRLTYHGSEGIIRKTKKVVIGH